MRGSRVAHRHERELAFDQRLWERRVETYAELVAWVGTVREELRQFRESVRNGEDEPVADVLSERTDSLGGYLTLFGTPELDARLSVLDDTVDQWETSLASMAKPGRRRHARNQEVAWMRNLDRDTTEMLLQARRDLVGYSTEPGPWGVRARRLFRYLSKRGRRLWQLAKEAPRPPKEVRAAASAARHPSRYRG
ncbi:MAG TPA: hypothetical protein VNB24_09095 [Acidimicrobiales bacterium]|nr:hypothetical protein [Acidimicrobiales bacterium]